MSNFPLSHLPLSHQFSAGAWLQSLHIPPFHLLACILSQYLNSPYTLFRQSFSGPKIPRASLSNLLHVSSCIFISFQCLGFTPHLSTTICAHQFQYRTFPSPYLPVNFLHPFRFIRRLPPLAPPPLLTFSLFQYRNFPGISNFLHASCLSI